MLKCFFLFNSVAKVCDGNRLQPSQLRIVSVYLCMQCYFEQFYTLLWGALVLAPTIIDYV